MRKELLGRLNRNHCKERCVYSSAFSRSHQPSWKVPCLHYVQTNTVILAISAWNHAQYKIEWIWTMHTKSINQAKSAVCNYSRLTLSSRSSAAIHHELKRTESVEDSNHWFFDEISQLNIPLHLVLEISTRLDGQLNQLSVSRRKSNIPLQTDQPNFIFDSTWL